MLPNDKPRIYLVKSLLRQLNYQLPLNSEYFFYVSNAIFLWYQIPTAYYSLVRNNHFLRSFRKQYPTIYNLFNVFTTTLPMQHLIISNYKVANCTSVLFQWVSTRKQLSSSLKNHWDTWGERETNSTPPSSFLPTFYLKKERNSNWMQLDHKTDTCCCNRYIYIYK